MLDLACGFGHVSHHLVRQRPTRPVVGMDRTFYIVWVASRYVAPDAWFACADADAALPLASWRFGAAVCVDAFHYLTHKHLVADELRRLTGDGPVVLARCGNSLVPPNEGSELAPDEYAALFAGAGHPVAAIDEDSLVDRYLQGLGPDLATATAQQRATGAAWVSIVAGAPATTDLQRFSDVPHARGLLGPNPVYRRRREADGRMRLGFAFPSPWYAAENARMSEYCRPDAVVDPVALGSLTSDDPLVRGFAVIGLPERYLDWRT